MNQNHYTQKDSDSMTATATYHDQMAGRNMGMSMGHFGGQNPNLFGDSGFYQIDQATFDAQNAPPIDPNQTPLLNNGESDFLQSFFDAPDQQLNAVNPFEFTARPDEKPALNGNNIYGAAIFDHRTGTINPSASAGQVHSSLQKPNVNSSAQPTYSGGQQDILSADDYRAAHTIGNLKEDYLTPNQPNFAGSWGNFMMPNLSMNSDAGGFAAAFSPQNNHMQGARQPRQAVNVSQQQQHGAQTPGVHQQHFYAQPQPQPAPQPPSRNQSVDSASQHARQQQSQSAGFQGSRSTPTALPHGHGRPSMVQWGSDPLFGQGANFTAPGTTHHHNKEGNLLNIYGAEQAALNGQSQKSHPKSTGRGNGITSPTGTHGGGSWGSIAMGAPSSSYNRDEQAHPRKRRKSHADREEEADWGVGQSKQASRVKAEDSDEEDFGDAAKAAAKRRKSAHNRQSVVSNSPGADEDDIDDDSRRKRNSKKARETLTEAQKRDNHIKSEKKRREIITTGYSDLNGLVPCLAAGKSGLSRSECLQEVASYLRSLVDGTSAVMSQLNLDEAEWIEHHASAGGQRPHSGFGS